MLKGHGDRIRDDLEELPKVFQLHHQVCKDANYRDQNRTYFIPLRGSFSSESDASTKTHVDLFHIQFQDFRSKFRELFDDRLHIFVSFLMVKVTVLHLLRRNGHLELGVLDSEVEGGSVLVATTGYLRRVDLHRALDWDLAAPMGNGGG